MTAKKMKVCLFGTSANPPTGIVGHTGIVSSLASLKKKVKDNDDDHLTNDDDNNNTLKFDEVHVLPVYRHIFTVSLKYVKSSFDNLRCSLTD